MWVKMVKKAAPGVIGMPGFVGYRVAMFMDSSESVSESAWPLSIHILDPV